MKALQRYIGAIIFVFTIGISGTYGQSFVKLSAGDSLFAAGEYESALKEYQQAASIGVPEADYKAAETLIRLGRYSEAENKGLKLLSTTSKKDSIPYADGLLILGLRELTAGKHDEAEQKFHKALTLFEKSGKKRRAALSLNNLGLLSQSTGEFEEALQFHQQALQLRLGNAKDYPADLAASYNNIGLLYTERQPDSALVWFERAESIYRYIYRKSHPVLLYLSINKALATYQSGSKTMAMNDIEALEGEFKVYFGDRHPTVAYLKLTAAKWNFEQENFIAAKQEAEEAAGIYNLIHGEKHADLASAYYQLSLIAESREEPEDAFYYNYKALNANTANFRSSNDRVIPNSSDRLSARLQVQLLHHYAQLLEHRHSTKSLKEKDLETAVRCISVADSLIEQIRLTTTHKTDKLELSKSAAELYETGVKISYRLSEVSLRKKHYASLCWYFNERSKSALLLSAIAEASAKSYAGLPAEVLAKEKRLKDELSSLEMRLAEASANNRGTVQQTLFLANRAYKQLEADLEKNYPAYFNLKYKTAIVKPEDMAQKLGDTLELVSYFLAENNNRVYIFTVSGKGLKIYSQPTGKDFKRWVNGTRNGIIYNEPRTFRRSSIALHKVLFPFRISSSARQLIVVPDGLLLRLPFEALVSKVNMQAPGYRGLRYLIQDYAVSYHYSATLFNQIILNAAGKGYKRSALLAAPVSFNYQYKGIEHMLPELSGTEVEVAAITEMCLKNQWSTSNFMYEGASEFSLKNEPLESFSYLHLATHGLVDETRPEQSRIFLAQSKSGLDDGSLFSGEIYAMKLRARLVTLSACQTGLGTISKGEGLIGLSRSLLYAGAENLVVSLWSVNDASTNLLMQQMYFNILTRNQESIGQSLRRARLFLIEESEFSAPFYWAPFIVVGK